MTLPRTLGYVPLTDHLNNLRFERPTTTQHNIPPFIAMPPRPMPSVSPQLISTVNSTQIFSNLHPLQTSRIDTTLTDNSYNPPLHAMQQMIEHTLNILQTPNTIAALMYAMTCISLLLSMVRPDFNFVIYLSGYFLWSLYQDPTNNTTNPTIHSIPPNPYSASHTPAYASQQHPLLEPNSNTAHVTQRTPKLRVSDIGHLITQALQDSVRGSAILYQYTLQLIAVTIVDVVWVVLASFSWSCSDNIAEQCFPHKKDVLLKSSVVLHHVVLYLSIVNALLKATVSCFSLWVLHKLRTNNA